MDFHLHTTASDGLLSPQALHAEVVRAGVAAWAVADHDTVDGWRALRGAPGLVAAVEATAGADGREVHVVGLGINPDSPELIALLAGNQALRRQRIALLIDRLPERLRRGLTVESVEQHAGPARPAALTRLHLARTLVAAGQVANTRRVFAEFLGDEHAADADLPEFPQLFSVANTIRAAGGLAILAHPGQHGTLAAIDRLMAAGLDGLEVRHPGLDRVLAAELDQRAAAAGWWCSAGSDLHFLGARTPGMCRLDDARRLRLTARLGLS